MSDKDLLGGRRAWLLPSLVVSFVCFATTLAQPQAAPAPAYNSVNGQPACGNDFLLKDTLRGAWHFDG